MMRRRRCWIQKKGKKKEKKRGKKEKTTTTRRRRSREGWEGCGQIGCGARAAAAHTQSSRRRRRVPPFKCFLTRRRLALILLVCAAAPYEHPFPSPMVIINSYECVCDINERFVCVVLVVRVATRWTQRKQVAMSQTIKKEKNNYQNKIFPSTTITHLNSTSKIKRAPSISREPKERMRHTHTRRIWPIKINNWLPVIIPHISTTTFFSFCFSLFQISLITQQLTTVSLYSPTFLLFLFLF